MIKQLFNIVFFKNENEKYHPPPYLKKTHLQKIQKMGYPLKIIANKFDVSCLLDYFVYMKIRNGAIYHSTSNNKAVRVVRAHQDEQIAIVKHHEQEHIETEVFFSDLVPATKDQVKSYLGVK